MHTHRLRHTAATKMLRAGADLAEIGQVLRHRRLLATAIYAKVDRGSLSAFGQALAKWWYRMSTLSQCLDDYPSVPRLHTRARVLPARQLHPLLKAGATTVTPQLAIAWATQTKESINWRADRLGAVRVFARYLQAIDPSTEVPPPGLLPRCNRRALPYIYDDAEVYGLMAPAQTLRPRIGRCTYATLIGLLAVTGMRARVKPSASIGKTSIAGMRFSLCEARSSASPARSHCTRPWLPHSATRWPRRPSV